MTQHADQGGYYEDDDVKEEKHLQHDVEPKSQRVTTIITLVVLIVIALTARLIYLFLVANPDNPGAGWFGDSYHHWQIGYLTKEIGLSQGFLRVWDLKGMDLFWGALHPLTLAFAFSITGNDSMALARAITCIAGAISVGLIYLIGRKYWNNTVAIMGALFAALCSIIIFNDATGMVEPLGIPFLLAGVYFWPRKSLLSGLCFGIALTTRSEYWMYSIGLIFVYTIWDRMAHMDKKVLLWLGLFIILVPYMKYLLDYTGNPVYPFYQNFFKNIAGEWQYKKVLEPADLQGQLTFRIILAITTLATVITLWKRPRGWQFHLLGQGNWLFLGLTFGVSNYIKSWADYVWVVRFMLFPYTYLGVVIAIALFYTFRERLSGGLKSTYTVVAAATFILFIGTTHLAWQEINKYYEPTNKTWSYVQEVATKMSTGYKGGKILLPEGNPDLTYALVTFHGVEGKDMLSQMYDPIGYASQNGLNAVENWNNVDPFSKEGLTFKEEVRDYLKTNKVQYIITYGSFPRYNVLVETEPTWFSVAVPLSENFIALHVNQDNL